MNPNKPLQFSEGQLNNFIRMTAVISLGILSLFLLVKTINEIRTYSTIGDPASGAINAISVNGKAEMFVKPDITVFSFNVDESGKTIQEAQSKAADKEKKAIAFLKEKGVKADDIKTTYYYTNTKYEDKVTPCVSPRVPSSEPSVVAPSMAPAVGTVSTSYVVAYPCGSKNVESGYQTTETVEVKVRDIVAHPEKAGELVAGLGTIGVKATVPSSSVDKPELYKQQVRAEAIANARKEAEVLARNLGVRLVKVTSFSENGGPYYPMYDRAMMSASAPMANKGGSPELPTGTDKISSEVTITYQIR